MDIAEKRLPQDGRIRVNTEDDTEVDFRVSTLRTLFGEKVVLRVLDHRKGVPPLEDLGFSAASLEELSVRVSCCRAVAIAEAVDAYAMDADPTAKLVAE